MKILSTNIYGGKNIYSFRKTAKIIVDLEGYDDVPTKEINNFNENLQKIFPELKEHHCSLGFVGGFLKRLEEGTYLAHVTEHLILAIQNRLGCDIRYGKARQLEKNIYYIVFEHNCVQTAEEIGELGVEIINSLVAGENLNNIIKRVDNRIAEIKLAIAEYSLGPSTKAIVDVAEARGIPTMRIGNRSLIQLGYGKNKRMISSTISDDISCLSADLASDKYTCKLVLKEGEIPVSEGYEVFNEIMVRKCALKIGYPVVVKPLLGNQGKGVVANINTEDELIKAYKEAKKIDKFVMVEKYIRGNDYRFLVVGDKVVAVARREPASIVGNGKNTIGELIEIENKNPLRGNDHEKVLTKIKIDDIMLEYLRKEGLKLNYIPKLGRKIYLRPNANLSTGGKAIDCTEDVCKENIEITLKAAKLIGLGIAGIDVIAEDISKPIYEQGGAIIEINASPGIRMHLYPSSGYARNVAEDIVEYIFPQICNGRIPIISVTGTNGKTTTTRMINEILRQSGKVVGMTNSMGVYIDNKCIIKGDCTGPISAKNVLMNDEIEIAVLETARGGIVKRGLGYDMADVGIITNIAEDHLGIDGINNLEELSFVKSLVAEAITPTGFVVLNADDKNIKYITKRIKNKIIYFSEYVDNPILLTHIKNGGMAVCLQDDNLLVRKENMVCKLINIKEIPATHNGKINCNIKNALAACAGCIALGVPFNIIRNGLKGFKADEKNNPGRFNLFNVNNFKVLVDYGHNPDGYKEVINYINKIKCKRKIGIIGMPGDRRNSDIEAMAEICAKNFDEIYIKEDFELRGRREGEISEIIKNKIKESIDLKQVHIEKNEIDALENAVNNAGENDLVVIFYEKFEPVKSFIHERIKSNYSSRKNII